MAKTRDQMVTIIADALGKSRAATAISGALLGDRCVDFITWGEQRIARSYNFEELNVNLETPVTVAGVARYPYSTGSNNLGLVRPKDIASIRLIDAQNSHIITRWSQRQFDNRFPYPINYSNGRPTLYIRYGNNIELFRIPDAIYSLYVRYPQWAAEMTSPTDVSSFEYKDQLLKDTFTLRNITMLLFGHRDLLVNLVMQLKQQAIWIGNLKLQSLLLAEEDTILVNLGLTLGEPLVTRYMGILVKEII